MCAPGAHSTLHTALWHRQSVYSPAAAAAAAAAAAGGGGAAGSGGGGGGGGMEGGDTDVVLQAMIQQAWLLLQV